LKMHFVDQLELLIFLETTLLLYFLLEFRSMANPEFDSIEWSQEGSFCRRDPAAEIPAYLAVLNLTDTEMAFGQYAEVSQWHADVCAPSLLFLLSLGACALLLTVSTCYLYMLKGTCDDNLDVHLLSWKFYIRTFMIPYALTCFVSLGFAVSILFFPCCYGAEFPSIGVCFLTTLLITYAFPYIDGRYSRGFNALMDEAIDRQWKSKYKERGELEEAKKVLEERLQMGKEKNMEEVHLAKIQKNIHEMEEKIKEFHLKDVQEIKTMNKEQLIEDLALMKTKTMQRRASGNFSEADLAAAVKRATAIKERIKEYTTEVQEGPDGYDL